MWGDVTQRVKAGGGQGLLLATDALYFADPGVGVQIGHGEELVAGLFDPVFHSQPVEQRALGLPLAARDFDQAPHDMSFNRKLACFYL